MNYQIIRDKEKLMDFIDNILPSISTEECFYCCLFARSKYTTGLVHIKSDKAQLKRFTSNKERLLEKIAQLECPLGSYKQKSTEIPQEALALYITINPRNLWRATSNSLVKLAQCIQQNNKFANPHQEVMSEIQRTKSRTVYTVFDIDSKEVNLSVLPNILGKESYHVLETRGGYHIIVVPSLIPRELSKDWYQAMLSTYPIDQKGDIMVPVPGCTQGNFVPTILNY